MIKRKALFFCIVLLTAGCQKSTEPITEQEVVRIKMEIISNRQLPGQVDSTLFYFQSFVEWNPPKNWLDTLHADSLAAWFSHSEFRLTDMWFPNDLPICFMPFNTFNFVFIRLQSPDTIVASKGFGRIAVFGPSCFPQWRHYKYTYAPALRMRNSYVPF